MTLASINIPQWRENNGTFNDILISNKSQNATLGTISSGAITASGSSQFTSNTGNPSVWIKSTRPTLAFTDTNSFTNDADRYIIRGGSDNLLFQWFVNGSGTTTTATLSKTGNLTITGALSGSLASSVTATTQTASDNSTKVATTAYVDSAVSGLVGSAPTALDTLNELASALGNDANFSTTVTNSIATKLPKAGGTMTGNLTIDYTGHQTGDAGLLVTNDSSDWGIKVDKDGTNTYGLLVQADGTHAIMVRNASGTQQALISGTGNADFEGTVSAGANAHFYTNSDRGYVVAGTNDSSNQHLYLGSYHGTTLKELTFSGSNNAFYPQTSEAIDLGLSTKKFKDLHISGSISSGAITSTGQTNTFYSGAGNGSLAVGRSSNQAIQLFVNDGDNSIIAYQDADGNSTHNFILQRDFDGTGANNFLIRKGTSTQLQIDTNANTSFFGNLYVPHVIYHSGDTNTYIQLTDDRIRLVAGGVTKFDSSITYLNTGNFGTTANTVAQGNDSRIVNGQTAYTRTQDTRLGLDSHSLTNLNTQALWSQPAGYMTMVRASNSNGLPSSHGESYFGYNVTSRRDTGAGYSAFLTGYSGNKLWFTYNPTETNYPTWKQIFHDGYHPNADKWTTGRTHTVTLTGQVTGTATQTVDGSANKTWSIATTLNDSALDDQYVTVGSRYTGNGSALLQASKASIRLWDVSTASDDPSGAGDGIVMTAGWDSTSWGVQQYHDFHSNDLYLRSKQNGTWMSTWDRVFHDTYHPNADKWTTARTLTLSGDLSGSVSFDGSSNFTLSAQVSNNSHNHDGTYTPIDHFRHTGHGHYTSTTTSALLSEALGDDAFDSKLTAHKTSWSYASNGDLTDAGRLTELAGTSWLWWTDNSTDNVQGNVTALAIAPTTGGSAGKVFIYNNQGSSYSPGWREVWTSTSDGAGSGLDADLLDGLQGSFYFKSYTNNNGGWSASNRNFSVRTGGNAAGLHMEESDGTFAFQIYGDGGTYGFLDGEWANWDIKKARNGAFHVDEGSGLKRVLNEANWSSYISIPTSLPANGGNADTVDSVHAHGTGRQNSANKLVRTDGNGYIQAGWINTTSGNNGTTTITRIYASHDDYIRYYTPANFGAQISSHINYNNIQNKPTIPTVGNDNLQYRGTWTTQNWNDLVDSTEAGYRSVVNTSGTNRPSEGGTNAYAYGVAINASVSGQGKFTLYSPHNATSGNGLWFRSGWNTDYDQWRRIAIYNVNSPGTNHLYAHTFYDEDDTAYYANPAAMSELKDLRTGKDHHTNTPRWDTSFYVAQSQHWYAHSSSQTMYIGESANPVRLRGNLRVGSDANANSGMKLTVAGSADATSSFRAQLFYDTNNTARFVDPASTSQLYHIAMNNGNLTGVNHITINDPGPTEGISWAGGNNWKIVESPDDLTTNSGGNFQFVQGSTRRMTLDTSGNFHIPSGSARAELFYDVQNTSYYVDPSSSGIAALVNGHVSIASGNGKGFRFWNSDSYKIYMSSTGDSAGGRVTGETTSDYNMYFRMNGGTNRGFVFKNADNEVAGIDASGNFYNTGVIKTAAGSASAPSVTTAADPNTGMFLPGSDVVKFTTGGTTRLTLNTTTATFNVQDVRIGEYLYHNGDTNTYIRMTGDRLRFVAGGVTFIDAVEGATDYLRFNTRGVTIGSNTAPQATFTVDQSCTETPANGCGTGRDAHIKLENTNTTGSASTCIIFNAKDSGGNMRHGAGIQFKKAIAWSANGQYPGELYFWTRPTSGNQAAAQKLDKDGNAIFKGNVTAYGSLSDRRLKENIEPITDAVAKVEQLEGVTFDYKKDGRRSTGLIAQDLEEVLPEAVYTTTEVEGTEEHKAIHYGNTVGLLVNAIKEQQQTINALTKRIEQLEANSLEEK